jgi:polysaccharide export outer membrane protein
MLGLFLLFVTGVFAQDTPTDSADVLTYPLGPGDEIRLEVVGQQDMSGVFRISADGKVTVPMVGDIDVSQMTLDEATTRIRNELARTVLVKPQVILKVEAFNSRRIDVSGGVVKPGTYSLQKAHTRVSEILPRAGGLADASAPTAQIYREVAGQRTSIPVDLDAIYKGDPDADLEVRAGDQLYVPPVQSIFVDGQVQKPGAIAYRDGMTLTQAITQAGSALGTARLSGVYVRRGTEKIPVNLKRVQHGDDADIALQPSDIIVVPESVF